MGLANEQSIYSLMSHRFENKLCLQGLGQLLTEKNICLFTKQAILLRKSTILQLVPASTLD